MKLEKKIGVKYGWYNQVYVLLEEKTWTQNRVLKKAYSMAPKRVPFNKETILTRFYNFVISLLSFSGISLGSWRFLWGSARERESKRPSLRGFAALLRKLCAR